MRHAEHDGVDAPMLDEGPELVFDIFGLLSGEPGHCVISAISLAREAMTGLAIFNLALKPLPPRASFGSLFRMSHPDQCEGEDNGLQRHSRTNDLHDSLRPFFRVVRPPRPRYEVAEIDLFGRARGLPPQNAIQV